MSLHYSRHGEQRVNQRGFLRSDVELIRRCGTQIEDYEAEVYLVLNKDIEQMTRALKQQIQRLDHLRGCKLVIKGEKLVTAHHTSRRSEKKLLRRAR